jgi:hypothetical protein
VARRCEVCVHPEKDEIDRQLLLGGSIAEISRKFLVSQDSLDRHKKNHLADTLRPSYSTQEIAKADNILEEMEDLHARTKRTLDQAEGKNDLNLALKAIREVRENIKLLGELAGRLQSQPQININTNIYNTGEWHKVGNILSEILEPYPDLKAQVAEGLIRLIESEAEANR